MWEKQGKSSSYRPAVDASVTKRGYFCVFFCHTMLGNAQSTLFCLVSPRRYYIIALLQQKYQFLHSAD